MRIIPVRQFSGSISTINHQSGVVVEICVDVNTVPSIRRRQTNITTSTNATLLPTNDMVVLGSVSVTATSSRILSVRNVRSKDRSLPPRKYTTSSRSPRAAIMKRVTSWLFVSHATHVLLLRVVTGGDGNAVPYKKRTQ